MMSLLELQEVSRILGGKRVLRKEIHSSLDFIELSDRGVPKSALTNLANYLGLSLRQMAQLLPISERTLQRYRAGKLFDSAVSEQILHIAEVAAKGAEVFEDKENFLSWLNKPNPSLAREAPINLLKSRFGANLVLEELGRMEHGVFS
jgi:putative toxin-antitoxin system antitoxin component (TIGR02293 family)